jgi:DNA-binding XRE family transcriptional regulator
MKTTTDHQILMYNGKPAFAIIPYDQYQQLLDSAGDRPSEEISVPYEVVKMSALGGMSLIRAWREHLGLTQQEVAVRMGITQSAYAKLEGGKTRPRIATCKRLATAMGLEWEQLMEERQDNL